MIAYAFVASLSSISTCPLLLWTAEAKLDLPEMIVRMDKGEDIFADEEDKKSCEADLDDDDDDDVDFASAVGGAGAAPKEKKINPAKQAELDEYISILTKTQLRVKEGEIPAHSEEVG
eukprot:CAMPEP_0113327938 /NCGR_PEP_ID=MMETSP0010_2-20120614/19662_1 /TAXON_ID=216773 ORGANISM="Corethron hystrix, Strain 308" /NCGR_SAMPLE_ID=MMETSP0010_2 /ASSEMBLY_ACC=CAM_ASM_000155 /LENGTH=117 /DNA_ID=CAMNT_0000189051 /DNA_START=31 /DNA_END=380 /DNA_ORIENTATION=+ /assembly_acc=CAM_ASM_000155